MAFLPRSRRKDFERLQGSCRARLVSLDLPPTADLTALCEHLSQRRSRKISLLPMPLGVDRPCGLWLSMADTDLIAYEANTARMHQEHIIAHELAHIICEHRSNEAINTADAQLLFPDLDPGLVREMLHRSHYSNDQEQEAEVMATMLLRSLRGASSAAAAGESELVSRLEQTLLPPRSERTNHA
jgi:hypothetical protein